MEETKWQKEDVIKKFREAMIMLMGKDGIDYALYEVDEEQWALRLWNRRN